MEKVFKTNIYGVEIMFTTDESDEDTQRAVDDVKALIAEKGTDAKYGARPLRRALQTELEDKLAEAILNGEVKRGDCIEAGTVKKEIRFIRKEDRL